MSAVMLFVILLLVGFGAFVCSSKAEKTGKAALIITGIAACAIAVFGLITAFVN